LPGAKSKPSLAAGEYTVYAPRREFKAGETPDQVAGWTSEWPNGERINAPGERVEAAINDSNGKLQPLFCDQAGAFNEIQAEIGSELEIKLHFPAARAGDEVWVTMEDGGILNGEGTERKQVLDSNLATFVRIGLAAFSGRYHAKVRHGRDVKTLRFWAGPLPQ
jgi:hypothetical protein